MIRVSDHLESIAALLAKHGLPPDTVQVVASVKAWCKDHGVEERNPSRAAKCFVSPDRCLIVVRDEQSDQMIRSAKERMELDDFEVEVSHLDTDAKYLEHLMLHEIACFELQCTEQKPRDRWAFEQMGIR
jgi:hypothetical protein